MLTVCYAAKGGSGTSVIAAAIALSCADAVLVDLAGDAPGVLGVDTAGAPGATDWLGADVDASALLDLAHPVTASLRLVPRGGASPQADAERWAELAEWLDSRDGPSVVDAGTGDPPVPLCEAASRVLLVTRPCYLALVRARRSTTRPDGVIVVSEPNRALGHGDVAVTLGVPVVARVHVHPAVARCVDAGLLATSLPRDLVRELRGVLRNVA